MKNIVRPIFYLGSVLASLIVIITCIKVEKVIMVSTGDVNNVQTNTATAEGTVVDIGEGVIQHGHVYGLSSGVTLGGGNLETKLGSKGTTGNFISELTNLTAGTKYYIRAYVTGNNGTQLGKEISFNTAAPAIPTISTTAITAITTTTAASGGNITMDGGAPVTARGVCWSTTTGPTITNSKTTDGTGNGSFVSNLTGLLPVTIYYVRAYAINSQGTSFGNEISFTTLATVPGAPTIGTATAGNAQATVTFTAPDSNGGSAITGYTVTSSPGSITANSTASPVTVTGLTNGTAYTFTVTATNAIGTSLASSASNTVTPSAPSTVPGAPTMGTATAGNAQATVTFTAPISNGGSAITGYTVTSNPGSVTGNGSASPITVTGLTNGTTYTFTITATNAIGTGPASAASNSVTPSTVPGAPIAVAATVGNAFATVEFGAPISNGGSAITGYTVTSSPGGLTGTGITSVITVTGLINGTTYTFTVTATNARGTGPASSASNPVTPSASLTAPGPPTGVSATAGYERAIVTFTAPVSNGGSPITGYTVTSSPDGHIGTGSTSPITVTALPALISYTFTVTATNIIGTGPASSASNSVTPTTVPGAPTIGTATKGDAQASVTFTAPVSDGGLTITGYTVTSSPGSITGTGSSSPIIITGLTNGTAYTFTITAINANGTGPASSASNSVTPCTTPSATTDAASNIGTTTATLNGTVNANGFSATVTFEWGLTTSYTGGTITATQSPVSGSTPTVVSKGLTGLTSNTLYHYRVIAVNCSPNPANGSDMTFTTLPVVTIAAISNITTTTALSGGNIDVGGGASITERGVCWSTGINPTIALPTKTTDGTGTGSFVSSITGLTINTIYYVRAYATNITGTVYSATQENFGTYVVGESYEGGLIFQVDATNLHGLIAAASPDQSAGAPWGCYGTTISGTFGNYGVTNTTLIDNGCTATDIAAHICFNLNYGGYTDWFLPSLSELDLMRTKLHMAGLGGFSNVQYWSSSQNGSNYAYSVSFYNGNVSLADSKNNLHYVRAARYF